jgi:hypothetical protein
MAYVHDTRYSAPPGGAAIATYTPALPDHAQDDVVFVSVFIDNPSAFTIGTSGAGWTVLLNTSVGGISHALLYQVAGASPLTAPTVTIASVPDNFSVVSVSVRDADTTTPIDAQSYNSGTDARTTAALTTSSTNTLLLLFLVHDFVAGCRQIPLNSVRIVESSKDSSATNTVSVRRFAGSGTAPAITAALSGNTSGGSSLAYIAVKNKSGGELEPEWDTTGQLLVKFGDVTTPSSSSLSAVASSIDGMTVVDATNNSAGTTSAAEWGQYGGMTLSSTGPVDRWMGLLYTIDSGPVDVTGGLVSVRHIVPSVLGAKGAIVVLMDGSSNWSAFSWYRSADFPPYGYTEMFFVFDFSLATPLATSATPADLSAVTKIGFAGNHNLAGGLILNTSFVMKDVLLWGKNRFVGGVSARPLSAVSISQSLFTADMRGQLVAGGVAQSSSLVPLQIGDGSLATVVDMRNANFEFNSSSLFSMPPESRNEFRIYASNSDVIDLTGAVFSATSANKTFVIDPSCSVSATVTLDDCLFSGLNVTWLSGIDANRCSFAGCYTVSGDGAVFASCSFSQSVAAAALLTSDPGNVSNCEFISAAGGGHALEISATGTFNYSGNTHTGYGAAGTSDAAVYNNSGGAVVLNILGGGDTPTVKNGSGASTTLAYYGTLTLQNIVVGSSYRVTRHDTGAQLAAGTAASTTEVLSSLPCDASPLQVDITVRKATSGTKYQPFQTSASLTSAGVSAYILQQIDSIA